MRAVLRAGVFVALAFIVIPSLGLADDSSLQTPATPAEKGAEKKSSPPAVATPQKTSPKPAVNRSGAKPLPPDLAGECAWIGQRIVSLLARDDVEQSRRFLEFYRLFNCREKHLALAFRCLIDPSHDAEQDVATRVEGCWMQGY